MNQRLKALRDAVLGPVPRRVEVGPNGEVREMSPDRDLREGIDQDRSPEPEERTATRLAPRVFGILTVRTQV